MATVDEDTTTKTAPDIQPAAGLSPPVPIARPATAHRISTSSRTAVSTAPVTPARAGVSLENERIQPGVFLSRCRVSHWYTPNAISADPRTTRSQDAHVGGAWCRSPSRSEAPTNAAVRATIPNSQPPRKARLAGRG